MKPTRPALLLALVAAALLAIPAVAGSATKPKVPKIKTRIAKVQIDVSGYFEMRRFRDTTSDCFPGESWTQVNRFDYDTKKFVNVSLKRVTGEGFAPVVTSPFTASTGSARVEGKIVGYRTTNYCTGEKTKNVEEPDCPSPQNGKVKISLQEVMPPEPEDDEELAPITSNKLQIVVYRTGGGLDDPECVGGGPDSLTGDATPLSTVTTSLGPGVSIALPSGITTPKLMSIRRGQKYTRTAMVTGPCTKANVRVVTGNGSSPTPGNLNADGDCQVAGKLTYTIKPRPAEKKK